MLQSFNKSEICQSFAQEAIGEICLQSPFNTFKESVSDVSQSGFVMERFSSQSVKRYC